LRGHFAWKRDKKGSKWWEKEKERMRWKNNTFSNKFLVTALVPCYATVMCRSGCHEGVVSRSEWHSLERNVCWSAGVPEQRSAVPPAGWAKTRQRQVDEQHKAPPFICHKWTIDLISLMSQPRAQTRARWDVTSAYDVCFNELRCYLRPPSRLQVRNRKQLAL